LEKRIIQLRLSTDKDMYKLTELVNQEGFPVGPRLIGQILSDYGINKKNPRARSKRTFPVQSVIPPFVGHGRRRLLVRAS